MGESATQLLKGFIALLATEFPEYKAIAPQHIKTTYAFMDAIRCDIRNKMDKVNQAIEDETLVVPTPPQSPHESQDEEDQQEEDDDSEEDPDGDAEVSPKIGKAKDQERDADT